LAAFQNFSGIYFKPSDKYPTKILVAAENDQGKTLWYGRPSGLNLDNKIYTNVHLNATVNYFDHAFTITNNDSFDWYDTIYYLNYKDIDLYSGYSYPDEHGLYQELRSHHSILLSDVFFTNITGEKFSSTPIKLLIMAGNEQYKRGSYLKIFNETPAPGPP
jgi:hypothetical protein